MFDLILLVDTRDLMVIIDLLINLELLHHLLIIDFTSLFLILLILSFEWLR